MTAHVMPLIVIISNLHTLRSHVVHFFSMVASCCRSI